jgi:hypothetical protein
MGAPEMGDGSAGEGRINKNNLLNTDSENTESYLLNPIS